MLSNISRTSRRLFLASVGSGLSFALTGCTASPDGGSGSTETAETTESTMSTDDGSSPFPTTSSTRTPQPDIQYSTFYVENYEQTDHCVTLSLTHAETGEAVLDGTWEVDADQAIEFPDVAKRDSSDDIRDAYEVSVELESGETFSDTWELRSCPVEDGYDRDGAVVVEDGALSLRANTCDAIAVGYQLPRVTDPEKGCD